MSWQQIILSVVSITVILAVVAVAWLLFSSSITTPSVFSTAGAKVKGLWHWITHNFWKIARFCFAIWLVTVIAEYFTNRPPPPPPKVYGPTEILYTLDMRNGEGNLVDFNGEEVSTPEEYFAVTVKGLDYFEGWYPRVNSMKPNEDRLVFSQSFENKFGAWKDIEGKSKKVKLSGVIQILRDLEYVPNKIGPIRGTFWKKGADPSKKEGSFSFTLYPPNPLSATKTLEYWD